ncbi:hypothetical protein [Exiguobacterium acetylicum]|uniref:hypothetical protein n=1 Tax=Exiguobacterium acetylicum TaxID=41170 RepID=UPI001EE30928|nr:hypothetical protein [Exiguobacterium acetylicum]UKS55830.1 hypothetical protein K6T22_15010 [Exiguobacterium acetylicum]
MNWKHWIGSAALIYGTWMTLTVTADAAPYDVKTKDQAIVGFYDLETKETTPYPKDVSPYMELRATSADKTLFLYQDYYGDEIEKPYYLIDAKTGASELLTLPEGEEYLRVLNRDMVIAHTSVDQLSVLVREGNQFVERDTLKVTSQNRVQWISANRFSIQREDSADWYDVDPDGTFSKVRTIDVKRFSPLTNDWILDGEQDTLRQVVTNQQIALPKVSRGYYVQGAYETKDGLYVQLIDSSSSNESSLFYFDTASGKLTTLVDHSKQLANELLADGQAIYRSKDQATMLSFASYLRQPIAIDDLTKEDTTLLEGTVLAPSVELTRVDGTTGIVEPSKLSFTGNVELKNELFTITTTPRRLPYSGYRTTYTTETGKVLEDRTRYQYQRYLKAQGSTIPTIKEGTTSYSFNINQGDVPVTVYGKDGEQLGSAASDETGRVQIGVSTKNLVGQVTRWTFGNTRDFNQEASVNRTVAGYEVPRITQSKNDNFKFITYRLESAEEGGIYKIYAGKRQIQSVAATKKTEITIPYTNDLSSYRVTRSGEYATKSLSLKDSVMIYSNLSAPLTDEHTAIEGVLDGDADYGKLYIDGKYTAYIDRKKTQSFAIKTKPLKSGQVVTLVARKGTQLQVSGQKVVAAANPTLKSYTTSLSPTSTSWKVKATKGKTIVVTINKKRYTKLATGKTQTMTFPKQKRGTRVTVHAESIKLRKSKTFSLTVK